MISRACHLHNDWSWKFPQGVNPVLRPTPRNCCVLSVQTLIINCLISAHLVLPENSKRFWRLDFISDFSKNFTINKKIPFSCHNDRGNGKIDRADHQKIINRSLIGVSVAR